MSRLVRATDLIALPVVTLGGDDVAEIRDVVYESNRGGLVGFTLNKRGFFSGRLKQVLTIDMVASIGQAAVMVADEDALAERADAPDAVTEASPERDVIGASVITDEGTMLGTVTDVVVSLGRNVAAVGYELTSTGDDGRPVFIPLPEQLSVSGDALMVPAGFEGFVRDDLTGFGGAVEQFRTDHGLGGSGNRANGAEVHPPRSGAAKAAPQRDTRTKAELYDEARRRDVPGRSSMTKAELSAALSDLEGDT